jgi:hypothetical protein
VSEAVIRIGVLELGSMFNGPYMGMIERLAAGGRARLTAVCDVDDHKSRAAGGVRPMHARPRTVATSRARR